MKSKSELREEAWARLTHAGVSRFPGARGRIPNFTGAEKAAAHLVSSPEFERAKAIKSNPDSPQRKVRHAALLAGKTVFMAVPKLAEAKPFLRLDPRRIDASDLWYAASIKGAGELGEPTEIDEMPRIDLIVTGCVAVTRRGARLGKGGGYSDLEYGLLRQAGKVGADTPIATTVHPLQIVRSGSIPMLAHDQSLDLIATPDGLVRTERELERAPGVLWDALSEEKIASIPVLSALRGGSASSRR